MMRVILCSLIAAGAVSAADVSNEAMCQSIGAGFGNAYNMTKKDLAPQEFCADIVSRNVANESFCTKAELTSNCIKQISSKIQK